MKMRDDSRRMEIRDADSPLVLIVDDFDDNREMFTEFLSFSGYRVAQAATGKEAIERAFSLLPCLLYTSPSPRDRTRSRMPSSA